MIISDRPLRIGDQCKVGSVEGYVMAIGLRSTRIRTFNRTIVTIPNGQLSTMNVENYTFRDKYWFHHIVTLQVRFHGRADSERAGWNSCAAQSR